MYLLVYVCVTACVCVCVLSLPNLLPDTQSRRSTGNGEDRIRHHQTKIPAPEIPVLPTAYPDTFAIVSKVHDAEDTPSSKLFA